MPAVQRLRRRLRAAADALLLVVAFALAINAAEAGTWSPLPLEAGGTATVRYASSNPSIVYAATYGAGVFRSADGGLTWTKTALAATYVDNVNRVVASVPSLVVSPVDANVVYALLDGGLGAVYNTTDGGATWNQVRAAGGGENFTVLAIAPGAPSTLYVGGIPGVLLKTTDGGANWSNANSGLPESAWVRDLAVDPGNANIAYVAIVGMAGVYKTTDGGGSWNLASTGIGAGTSSLVIDPVSPATLYAVTVDGVFKSTDAAASWSASGSGLPGNVAAVLAIDPGTPATLYARADDGDLYRSIDAGASWAIHASDLALETARSLAVHPAVGSTLLAASLRGPLRSTNGGATWTPAVSGFIAARVQALAYHPSDPNTAYAGTEFGLYKTTDDGATWAASGPIPSGIDDIVFDPSNASVIYLGTGSGVYKSTDAGATWTATPPTGGILGIGIDANAPANVYAAGYAGLYKSTDGAASWTLLGGGLPVGVALSVVVDPANSSIIYVGTDGSGVYKSTDGGTSFADASPFNNSIYDLLFDPSAVLYALTNTTAFSSNGGTTWAFAGTSPGTGFDFSLDPTPPHHLYVAKTTGFVRIGTNDFSEVALNAGLVTHRGHSVAVAADGLGVLGGSVDGVFALQGVCGDGITDLGEACDDGGNAAGDCCSPSCQFEADGSACTDATFCNGADTCSAGACVHSGDPCIGGAECHSSCNEANDSCITAGIACSDDGDPCTLDECDASGACAHADSDGDSVGDLCDNCVALANASQTDSDCPDPTFRSSGGCDQPAPSLGGCCDGGDVCDACPLQADNDSCTPGGTVAASVDSAGGSLTTPDGTLDLVIPSGALGGTTGVSISRSSIDADSGAVAVSITAGPPGLTFSVPVAFTFRWADRDDDGRVDVGLCIGGTDDGLSCDSNAQCPGGSCSTGDTQIAEAELVLKHDGQRIGLGGVNTAPFRCGEHDAGSSGCLTAVADCNDAPGTGQSAVAQCCDESTNQWSFQTCSFSQFLLSLREADLVPGRGSATTDCFAEWGPENPYNTPKFEKITPRPPKAPRNRGVLNFVQTCTNGDPLCDQDGLASNCSCSVDVKVSLNVADSRLRDRNGAVACSPIPISRWTMRSPRPDNANPTKAGNAQRLRDAVHAAAPGTIAGTHQETIEFATPLAAEVDSAAAAVVVPLTKLTKPAKKAGRVTIKMTTETVPPLGETKGAKDTDKLKLVCLPSGQEQAVCP